MKSDCIFCKIVKGEIDSKKIYENENILAILDIDPINEGHILIIPKEHILDIDNMPISVLNEISLLSKKIVKIIKEVYNPCGYSMMQNGGSFDEIGHYHQHIFPRYNDDGFGWTSSKKEFNVSIELSNRIKEKLESIESGL